MTSELSKPLEQPPVPRRKVARFAHSRIRGAHEYVPLEGTLTLALFIVRAPLARAGELP